MINYIPTFLFFILASLFLMSFWKLFEKMGMPGWIGIIPLYNIFVLMRELKLSVWIFLLSFIPIVGIITGWITTSRLASSFNKGTGFFLGLFFLPMIFYPILAFDDSSYRPENI